MFCGRNVFSVRCAGRGTLFLLLLMINGAACGGSDTHVWIERNNRADRSVSTKLRHPHTSCFSLLDSPRHVGAPNIPAFFEFLNTTNFLRHPSVQSSPVLDYQSAGCHLINTTCSLGNTHAALVRLILTHFAANSCEPPSKRHQTAA